MASFNSETALIYMDIFFFNVNEEKNLKVKKFELLISTSTYELQLYNGYIFIFYFKIWQWYIAFLSKILYISDVINEFVVISDIRYGVFREP